MTNIFQYKNSSTILFERVNVFFYEKTFSVPKKRHVNLGRENVNVCIQISSTIQHNMMSTYCEKRKVEGGGHFELEAPKDFITSGH